MDQADYWHDVHGFSSGIGLEGLFILVCRRVGQVMCLTGKVEVIRVWMWRREWQAGRRRRSSRKCERRRAELRHLARGGSSTMSDESLDDLSLRWWDL